MYSRSCAVVLSVCWCLSSFSFSLKRVVLNDDVSDLVNPPNTEHCSLITALTRWTLQCFTGLSMFVKLWLASVHWPTSERKTWILWIIWEFFCNISWMNCSWIYIVVYFAAALEILKVFDGFWVVPASVASRQRSHFRGPLSSIEMVLFEVLKGRWF